MTAQPEATAIPASVELRLGVRGIGGTRSISIRFSIAKRWNIGFSVNGVVVSEKTVTSLQAVSSGDGSDIIQMVSLARRASGEAPSNVVVTATVTDDEDGAKRRTTSRVEITN